MAASKLTARRLRLILWASLFPLLALGVALFMFGYHQLKAEAQKTSEVATQAAQGSQEQSNLIKTKSELAANSLAIQRAKDLVAKSKSYQYQNQLTEDVYRLASQTGVGVTGIAFTSETTGASGTGATAPTAPKTSSSSAATTPAIAPAGMKTASATISLVSPIPYDKFLLFLYAIEQNSIKMRIDSVALSAASDPKDPKASNLVNSDSLSIEVYLDNEQ